MTAKRFKKRPIKKVGRNTRRRKHGGVHNSQVHNLALSGFYYFMSTTFTFGPAVTRRLKMYRGEIPQTCNAKLTSYWTGAKSAIKNVITMLGDLVESSPTGKVYKQRGRMAAINLTMTALLDVSNIDRMVLKNHFFRRFFNHQHVIREVYKNPFLKINFNDNKYTATLHVNSYLNMNNEKINGIVIKNRSDIEKLIRKERIEKEGDKTEGEKTEGEKLLEKLEKPFDLTYLLINNAALVDRFNLYEKREQKKSIDNLVVFEKRYDSFFSYLHLLKYQLKRVLWTPHGLVTMKYVLRLIALQNKMLLQNQKMMDIYRANSAVFFTSIAAASKFSPKGLKNSLLDEYTYAVANGDSDKIKQYKEEAEIAITTAEQIELNTEAKASSAENKVGIDTNNTTLPKESTEHTQTGGGWLTQILIYRKLRKFYDVEDKYSVSKKFFTHYYPKYAEAEAKYAIMYAINILVNTANDANAEKLKENMQNITDIRYNTSGYKEGFRIDTGFDNKNANNDFISIDDLTKITDLTDTDVALNILSYPSDKRIRFVKAIQSADLPTLVNVLASFKSKFNIQNGGKYTKKNYRRYSRNYKYKETRKVKGGAILGRTDWGIGKGLLSIGSTASKAVTIPASAIKTGLSLANSKVLSPVVSGITNRIKGIAGINNFNSFLNIIFDCTYDHMIKRIINHMTIIGQIKDDKLPEKIQLNTFKYFKNTLDVEGSIATINIEPEDNKKYAMVKDNTIPDTYSPDTWSRRFQLKNQPNSQKFATLEDLGIFLSSTISNTMLLQFQICMAGWLSYVTSIARIYSYHCYLSTLVVSLLYINCLVLTEENCRKIQNLLSDSVYGNIPGDNYNYTLTELCNAYNYVAVEKQAKNPTDHNEVDIIFDNENSLQKPQNTNTEIAINEEVKRIANDVKIGLNEKFGIGPEETPEPQMTSEVLIDPHPTNYPFIHTEYFQPFREMILGICLKNQHTGGRESITFKDVDYPMGSINKIKQIGNCVDIKKNSYVISTTSTEEISKNIEGYNILAGNESAGKPTDSTEGPQEAGAMEDTMEDDNLFFGDIYSEYRKYATFRVSADFTLNDLTGVNYITRPELRFFNSNTLNNIRKFNFRNLKSQQVNVVKPYIATIKPQIKYTKTNKIVSLENIQNSVKEIMNRRNHATIERAPTAMIFHGSIPNPPTEKWLALNKWYYPLYGKYGDHIYFYNNVVGKLYGYYERYTTDGSKVINLHCQYSTETIFGYTTLLGDTNRTITTQNNNESHDNQVISNSNVPDVKIKPAKFCRLVVVEIAKEAHDAIKNAITEANKLANSVAILKKDKKVNIRQAFELINAQMYGEVSPERADETQEGDNSENILINEAGSNINV